MTIPFTDMNVLICVVCDRTYMYTDWALIYTAMRKGLEDNLTCKKDQVTDMVAGLIAYSAVHQSQHCLLPGKRFMSSMKIM